MPASPATLTSLDPALTKIFDSPTCQVSHAIYHYREPKLFTVLMVAVLLFGPLTLWNVQHARGFSTLLQMLVLLAKQILVYFAAMAFSIAAYRCTPLHPLYHVPGPPICRLTQLWLVKCVVRGKTRFVMQDLHRKYGDVVRIGEHIRGTR